MNGKNLYLLGEKELPNRQPDIHEMIMELEKELARGDQIYTKAELAKLDRKLEEYKELYRVLSQA